MRGANIGVAVVERAGWEDRRYGTPARATGEVGRQRLDAGESAGALKAAERALGLDACNERLVQLAKEAEAALDRREAVIERYERLCRDLDERLGLEPERETRRLHRHLLSQDPAPETVPLTDET